MQCASSPRCTLGRYTPRDCLGDSNNAVRVGWQGARKVSNKVFGQRALECFSRARASAASCFWPALSGEPPSDSTMSRPAGAASTTGARCARRSAAQTCSNSVRFYLDLAVHSIHVQHTSTYSNMLRVMYTWPTRNKLVRTAYALN